MGFSSLAQVLSAVAVVASELLFVGILFGGLYGLAIVLLRAIPARPGESEWRHTLRLRIRTIVISASLAMAVAVLGINLYLIMRGTDLPRYTAELLASITVRTWIAFAVALGQVALAIVALQIVIRIARRLLGTAQHALHQSDRLGDNNRSVAALVIGLERLVVHGGWMLVAVLAAVSFALPARIVDLLVMAVRVYVVVAIGLIVIRSTTVIVDTLDGVSQRYAEGRDWSHHYDHLRALLPTFRACLEYALWIGVASLALIQLNWMQNLAVWGPRAIQAIVIFFVGRVIIELGQLEIAHRMLPPDGIDDNDRRRRVTMIPLVRSAFTYAIYFGTAVLILGSLGFNPMPFLAGAGLLGLVIGFGAQSLINDVVSGFFILFENIYLVGDVVEVGAARGVVEAIEFRTTKIRDDEGRVHIFRNGDMKPVINYSKDYGIAVVAVEVPYDADLHGVFATLQQASERLRVENAQVLNETRIDGITSFGASTMTIRTSTRVRAGQHETTAAALRMLIHETFERQSGGAPRKTLIVDGYAKHPAALARARLQAKRFDER